METASFFPHYLYFGNLQIAQTLITSIAGTILFVIFVLVYRAFKTRNINNLYVQGVDTMWEWLFTFFQGIDPHLSRKVIMLVVFLFTYILRSNLLGLLGDMFALVLPWLHQYFRPVTSDVYFNGALALLCVGGSLAFGFRHNGLHFIEKYIPWKWFGIIPKVNSIGTLLLKPFDILIGLFIGFIEAIGEVAKVLSLSLRLFGNIFAGMVLLGLVVGATQTFIHVPLLTPLIVFLMELLVSCIQAFVFSTLVLVYFKMAGESATH